jgi:hypothetical protein
MLRCLAFCAAACDTFDATAHTQLWNNMHRAWSTAAPSQSDSDLRMPRLCRHTPEPVPCTAAHMGHTCARWLCRQLAPCRSVVTCPQNAAGLPVSWRRALHRPGAAGAVVRVWRRALWPLPGVAFSYTPEHAAAALADPSCMLLPEREHIRGFGLSRPWHVGSRMCHPPRS